LQILDMHRQQALLRVQSSREQVFDRLTAVEQAEAARLDDARTSLQSRVGELVRRVAEEPDAAGELASAQRERLAAEAAWEAFQRRLQANYRLAAPPEQPLAPEEVGELIADGEALLMYSVGEYETCAILTWRSQARLEVVGKLLPIHRRELERLVEALRLGCLESGGSYRVLAAELHRVLLSPFAEQLSAVKLLAVAADGPLYGLPLAVLEDERGTVLIERTAIAAVPSAALLRKARGTPPAAGGALLVGVDQFDNRAWVPSSYASQIAPRLVAELLPPVRLAELPGTRAEIDRIASLFGAQAERLSGSEAREERFLAAAAGKRFIHLATHGLVDAHNPFASALVLGPPQAGSREDGFLEAAEILQSPAFRGADLVTLSACESGLGLAQGSEGVLGLSWAFLAAGNRSVLASLWSVDDAATSELMVQTYRHLLAGRSKAEALRQAALALRARPATAHASYWAPFQVTGDWR
jgi:CHAT domain-containing protein